MKIVITDAQTVTKGDVSLDPIRQFGEVIAYPLTSPEELIERVKDADAILTNRSRITREVMEACPNLRYIGLFATGYNNIDVIAARDLGITVCNAGSYSTNSVAQQVFAFILYFSTKVDKYNNFVQEGRWIAGPTFSPFVFDMFELHNKTLGIFGFGNIGKAVATIARAFGMRVIVSTRTICEEDASRYGISHVDFETLLKESDFLTVHCPLNAQTEGLFNAEAFSQMKPGAFFINTSRGAVLDEHALRNAVVEQRIAGAGIDVLTIEPMTDTCPLLGVDNIAITPHVAWAPYETRMRLLSIVTNNIKAFLNGTPTCVVS